jgi:hypothetical protein
VKRTGSLHLPAATEWRTWDGTAVAGSDYVAGNGTLTFARGERRKSITVRLLKDAAVEPAEWMSVLLEYRIAAGGRRKARTTAHVSIVDTTPIFAGDPAVIFEDVEGQVFATAEQTDGRILAGMDAYVGDESRDVLRRFWPDGRRDSTFLTPDDVPSRAIHVLNGGDIIVSRDDSNARGLYSQARLSANGRFKSGTIDAALLGTVSGELPDGTLVMRLGEELKRLGRDWNVLHSYPASGSPPNNSGFPNGFLSAAAVLPDGRVMAAWWPDRAGVQWTLVRFSSEGVVDASFAPVSPAWWRKLWRCEMAPCSAGQHAVRFCSRRELHAREADAWRNTRLGLPRGCTHGGPFIEPAECRCPRTHPVHRCGHFQYYLAPPSATGWPAR